jgi:hypothetical protein
MAEETTRAHEIRIAVEEFLSGQRPGDLSLVYLSCHGLMDARRRLYFAATDTVKDRLAATGIEARWLLDQLEECRARRQVVILDCCFSGAFTSPWLVQIDGIATINAAKILAEVGDLRREQSAATTQRPDPSGQRPSWPATRTSTSPTRPLTDAVPARSQQTNTDQQTSFRNRWSSSTSSRIASGSWSRCHRHSSLPALSLLPSGAAACAALIA